LAELANLNGRHLQRIERGAVDLHVSSLEVLATVLRVTPSALLRPAKLEPSRPGRPSRRRTRNPRAS
jgi:transcriptional regulator with XRE-family HTH domain